MDSIKTRRDELQKREFQLKESLLKFDKFLKVFSILFHIRPVTMPIFLNAYLHVALFLNLGFARNLLLFLNRKTTVRGLEQ